MMNRQIVRAAPLLLFAGFAGIAGGCVGQQAYDEQRETIRALTSRNQELQNRLQELRSTLEALEANRAAVLAAQGEAGQTNAQLRAQLQQQLEQIRTLEDQLADLNFGGLDPRTDMELARLAEQYPGLITYDPDRGMLRFASDLTFASGSANVQPEAAQSLNALADILQTPAAQEAYDVIVVGHTDSEQPSGQTRQRFPTNMHLSAARAISVRQVLANQGVQPARMQAAGWGEHRPLVPNTPSGNTPRNRRVEIYLVPSTLDTVMSGGTPPPNVQPRQGAVDQATVPGARYEPTK